MTTRLLLLAMLLSGCDDTQPEAWESASAEEAAAVMEEEYQETHCFPGRNPGDITCVAVGQWLSEDFQSGRVRIRSYVYQGPHYENYEFIEDDGTPIRCTRIILDHLKRDSVCWQETIGD
jgi:ABC-type Fe3+-hydroxamate transport system substrate-binding protein